MHIDVPTLYSLTVGTLCVAVAMTVWERKAIAHRTRELGLWATAYAILALGCVLMMKRTSFPGVTGSALANIVFVLGYLGLLWGALSLDGKRLPRWPFAMLAALAAGWTFLGSRHLVFFWNHLGSLPIAATCCATAWTLLRSRSLQGLRSRSLASGIAAGHGLFYLCRAVLGPVLVAVHGEGMLATLAVLTMFEAVMFSVAMPMALLSLVREEAQGQLLLASRTDYLTGIDNRRAFMAKAAQALSDARRPSAVIVFDLDHFKTINDRHGHGVGDDILRQFCRSVEALMVPGDVFGRLGGEEFAVVFHQCDAVEAQHRANLVSRLYTTETAVRFDLPGRATVSGGIAISRADASLQQLLREADEALYRAKAAGRDRTLLAENGTVVPMVENAQVA